LVSYIQVKSVISHNFMPYLWQFHFPANLKTGENGIPAANY